MKLQSDKRCFIAFVPLIQSMEKVGLLATKLVLKVEALCTHGQIFVTDGHTCNSCIAFPMQLEKVDEYPSSV